LELIQGRETFIESIEGEKKPAENSYSEQASIVPKRPKISKQQRLVNNEK